MYKKISFVFVFPLLVCVARTRYHSNGTSPFLLLRTAHIITTNMAAPMEHTYTTDESLIRALSLNSKLFAVCARASGARIPYRVQVVNDERVYWMAIIAEDGGRVGQQESEEDMLYVSDAPAHFF